jgi:hypothetical protein
MVDTYDSYVTGVFFSTDLLISVGSAVGGIIDTCGKHELERF